MNNLLLNKFESGTDFNSFLKTSKNYIETIDTSEFEDEEKHLFEYTKLNNTRMERCLKTYKIPENLLNILTEIKEEQNWLVITENWCGDSAQILPGIYLMSEAAPKVKLSIIERDKNLDIMDQYLTNGSRSIPKLISIDNSGKELFNWGARPQEAQNQVTQWVTAKIDKEIWHQDLHLWYAKNRGVALFTEFEKILLDYA